MHIKRTNRHKLIEPGICELLCIIVLLMDTAKRYCQLLILVRTETRTERRGEGINILEIPAHCCLKKKRRRYTDNVINRMHYLEE